MQQLHEKVYRMFYFMCDDMSHYYGHFYDTDTMEFVSQADPYVYVDPKVYAKKQRKSTDHPHAVVCSSTKPDQCTSTCIKEINHSSLISLHFCTFQSPTLSSEMSTPATLPCALSNCKGVSSKTFVLILLLLTACTILLEYWLFYG